MLHKAWNANSACMRGVDEDQRQLVRADRLVDVAHGVAGGVAGERQACRGLEDADPGAGAARDGDEPGRRLRPAEKTLQVGGLPHRRRQADRTEIRREAAQARETERKQVAALGGDERVQLVEHDVAEVCEEGLCVAMRDQQRQLLGRRQQDIGRAGDLARALGGGGVAGAGLDLDGQRHLGDRHFEIAGDIDGQCLQRRDVERMQAFAPAGLLGQFDQ